MGEDLQHGPGPERQKEITDWVDKCVGNEAGTPEGADEDSPKPPVMPVQGE